MITFLNVAARPQYRALYLVGVPVCFLAGLPVLPFFGPDQRLILLRPFVVMRTKPGVHGVRPSFRPSVCRLYPVLS